MGLLLDEAQQAIAREAERIVSQTSDRERSLALLERPGAYDEPLWQAVTRHGWTAIAVPETAGGLGLGLSEVGLVAQALGAVAPSLPFVLTNYGVVQGLRQSPDSWVTRDWLKRLATGEAIGAVALPEGFDPLPSDLVVTFQGGVLNGVKPAVAAGSAADCALVLAGSPEGPVLAFTDLADLERDPLATYDPGRCHADLVFVNTPAVVLAEGLAALAAARDVLARMAVTCAYEQLGGAEALMLIARDYAKTRKAFGQPIGAFQAVKHRIAELYGLVEIARANCAAAAEAEGKPGFLAAAATARLAATEAYDTAARDCMQIHGGIGVTWELGLHLHMRRARSLASELGNALFWEDWLVGELAA